MLVALSNREQHFRVVPKEHVRAVLHVHVVTRWTCSSLCHGMVCVTVRAVLTEDLRVNAVRLQSWRRS